MIDIIYILISENYSWNNLCIYTNKEEAINESIKNPKCHVQIFGKKGNKFIPTFNYYENGELKKTFDL